VIVVAESQTQRRMASPKARLHRFSLLEMNAQLAASPLGENDITAYPGRALCACPWPKAVYVRELFRRSRRFKDGQWKSAISHFHRRKAFSLRPLAGRH